MPTYAYECKDCGHHFDVHQSFSDDSLTTCPECSGPLRKKFNTVGVVFKGSGFYRTDSRKGADVSKPSGSSSGSDSSSGAKKDSGTSSKESSTAPSTPPAQKATAKSAS